MVVISLRLFRVAACDLFWLTYAFSKTCGSLSLIGRVHHFKEYQVEDNILYKFILFELDVTSLYFFIWLKYLAMSNIVTHYNFSYAKETIKSIRLELGMFVCMVKIMFHMPSIFCYACWNRTIEVGADRFKIPDIIFNPSLVQVGIA